MGRRKKGQPPQMRKATSKGYHTAYVYLDGKKSTLGRWGSAEARQAYKRIIVEWERDHAGARDYRPSGLVVTVADLIAAFMDHAKVYYRNEDGTATDEVRAFRTSLSPLLDRYGDKAVEDIRPKDLEAITSRWIADGLSRKTVNKMLGRIKRAFWWAVPKELVSHATAALLGCVEPLAKGRTLAKEMPDQVPPAHWWGLLRVFCDLDELSQLAILVQVRTGARPGEVCRMRGDEIHTRDITVGSETLMVPTGCWAWRPSRHKTKWRGKEVIYLIGPRLQTLLAPYLAKANGGPLWHLDRDWHSQKIKLACREANLPTSMRWSPGRLRHNYLTRRHRKGGAERARQSVMHSSKVTTLAYIQRDLDEASDLTRTLD